MFGQHFQLNKLATVFSPLGPTAKSVEAMVWIVMSVWWPGPQEGFETCSVRSISGHSPGQGPMLT